MEHTDACVKKIRCVHFFAVEKSLQSSYAFHTDCSELLSAIDAKDLISKTDGKRRKLSSQVHLYGIRSVVVQLGAEAQTAMYVHGAKHPSVYLGQGAVKCFHGSAIHASLPWLDSSNSTVWKVSLFWMPCDLGFDGEVP